MNNIVKSSALLAATLLLTGFNWSLDPCKDALEMANSLSAIKDDQKLRQNEAKILSLCPDGGAAHYVTALQLERIGNFDGAVSEYRKALRQEKNLPIASGNLGLIYAQKGLLDEASVELARGLLTSTPNPLYQKALGKILAQHKVYPLAVHYLTEAAAGDLKNDAEIPAILAEIYAASGQLDKAIDEYQRTLSLEPGNEKAQIGIATIMMEQKKLDMALAELKKAELVSPQNKQIHMIKASIYEKKGDTKLAEYEKMMGGKAQKNIPAPTPEKPAGVAEDVEKTISSLKSDINDSSDNAVEKYEKLGNLYKAAGKDAEAIVAYKDAIYHNSTNSDIYLNLGILYEKQGHLDEAVVAYKQAVKLKPENAEARLRLAEIRNERGFIQEAVEQYSEFLKLKPESPDIQLKLARIFAKSKESTLAINAYNSVLKQVPDNAEANREIANLYKLKDMDEKAIEHYKIALAQQKDDLETRGALVSLYVKNRKYDDITGLLKETAELFPDDPNNHYKLGLIYEFKKDFEMAIGSYKKTVEMKPDHARALNAIGRLYMKNGKYAEAKEALEAARKADPNLEETAILLSNIRDDFNPEPRKIIKKSRSKSKKSAKKAKTGKKAKNKKTVKKK